MADTKALERKIFRDFKAKGLSITGDGSKALIRVLNAEEDKEGSLKLVVDRIKERIDKKEIQTYLIDDTVIRSVVEELTTTDEDLVETSTELFDAFVGSPKLLFDERQRTYRITLKEPFNLHGPATSRAQMYRERIVLAQQRLLRNNFFIRSLGVSVSSGGGITGGSSSSGTSLELSPIEALLGSTGTKILFGMLTQPEEGQWYLEDLSSTIRLDFSRCAFDCIVTEGCMIIIDGDVVNKVFRVQNLRLPPLEEREKTLKAVGVLDYFQNCTRSQQLMNLRRLEEDSTDVMMVILCDILLDKPTVCEKLQEVFEGFENNSNSNPLFILMGPFVSKSATVANGRDQVLTAFNNLAEMIEKCPRIAQNAKFLIIPGNMDAGLSTALPRRGIPEIFTKKIKEQSNSCYVC